MKPRAGKLGAVLAAFRPRLLVGLCLLALAFSGLAQSPPPSPRTDRQQQPLVRVTTRLVQVNVVVNNRHGNPVPDLKREDFVLFDEKEQQEIQVFAMETSQSTTANDQLPPPNTFSNHLDRKGTRPGSVTVILLDGLNTRFEDQAYSKMQIIKFLQQLQPHDRVALYTLGQNLRILHDFTSDAAPLLRALARHRGRTSGELDASDPEPADTGNNQLDAFLNDANARISDFYTVRRVERTLAAIEAIANHLQAVPGRKNLVWVSGSFPFAIGVDDLAMGSPGREIRTFSREIERAVRAVNSANLAIYPVDARGLVGAFGPRGGAAQRRPGFTTLGQVYAPIDSMKTLAERTGGRAFYNTNDISGSVRSAIDDSRVTYILGYYPSHGTWNGKFRRLKVQVTRPGTSVRYRQGYFALAEPQLDEAQADNLMRASAWNPLDATGLGLTVGATRFESSGSNWVKLDVQIDGRDVVLQQKDGHWVGALDYLYIQRREDGAVVTSAVRRLDIDLTSEQRERARAKGMQFSRIAELRPGAQLLMFVVRDPATGAIGTVRVPLSKLLELPPS